jgi:hypothetical protein
MAYTNRILYESIRSIDSSTFTGSYQALGDPLAHSACIIKMVNNSDQLVTISIDGINDHDILPANSFFLYDYTSNTPPGAVSGEYADQGRQYLVKGSAGTGSVYLVVQYIVTV